MLSKRQKQIIEESINIIHSEGIQGFTIKNLSNALNLSEAAIYRHFKSKTEILCALLDSFIEILNDFIKLTIENESNSLEKIKSIFEKLSLTFSNKPAYVSVIFAEEIFKNEESLSVKVNKILKKNNDAFNFIIENGQKNNEITKNVASQELTLMTMGAFRLMVKNWKMSDFSFELKKSSERLYFSIETLISVHP
ncbi:MAG: TetR/AcrR family transcriptional regulator [Bacteroidota bacterium]